MHLATNTLLQGGKYKIIEKIGQGGFGIVYKALHKSLKTEVCIKEFFYSDLCERVQNSSEVTIISKSEDKIKLVDSLKKKFVKEAQRLAKFHHPNIVQVKDTFEENNTAYYVMEYLAGGNLDDLIARDGALNEQITKEIVLILIDALEAIHKIDLLHLDIKPANIMLRQNQSPVLIDFGVSKYMELSSGATTTAPVGISKGYAPIEQYGGSISDFSEATDIYSFCATIYKIVTGQTPPEPLQILGSGLNNPKNFNSDLSDNICSLIIKGMSIKADERYQHATDIKKVITSNLSFRGKDTEIDNPQTTINTQLTSKLNKYSDIGNFSEGLAMVKLNDKKGFIDKAGREVIACQYNDVKDFSEGLAEVKMQGKYGLINKDGQEVIPCNCILIVVNEGFIYVMDESRKEFIYINGKGLVPCNYDEISLPREGIAKVKSNSKYGFIDKMGIELIPCKYEKAEDFLDGFAAVSQTGHRYGYINKNNRVIIPDKYLLTYSFSHGHAIFYDWNRDFFRISESGYGLIDKKGNVVITSKYSEVDLASYYSYGIFIAGINKGIFEKKLKYGALDLDGKEIIPFKYDSIKDVNNVFDELSSSMKSIRFIDGKMWSFDQNNKKILCIPLDDMKILDGLYAIMEYGKIGIVDQYGREVAPPKFDDGIDFSEGLIPLQLNGKWGFLDKAGKVVIPFIYEETDGFSDGLSKVKLNGKFCFIDKQGKVVLE